MRPLIVQFSARTDTGRVRVSNEDNYLVDRKLKLYVVCDGLGGHRGGEVASAMAVNAVREAVVAGRHIVEAHALATGAEPASRTAVEALLRDATKLANQRIRERAEQTPTLFGMGTTMSLLLIAGADAFVAHVGDSRIYRLRAGQLELLTRDHSLANELGPLSGGSLLPMHNHITRAVGVHATVEVDLAVTTVLQGDRFLLTTDGLHGLVPDADIAQHLGVADVSEAANQLVDRANRAGGKDNVTVIVAHVEAPPPQELEEPARTWPLFESIRATGLLSTLDDDELVTILRSATAITLTPHETLVHEGRGVAGLYIVGDGEAQVVRGGEVVTTLRAGDWFGEDALLGERASFASVVGVGEPSTAIVLIDRNQFEDLQSSHPTTALKIALAIARALARKVHGAVREAAHPRLIFKDPGALSRPLPRPLPRTGSHGRVLADTEPQLPAVAVPTTDASPPSPVLQRPRASTRRIHPVPTQPDLPALPEPAPTSLPATRPSEPLVIRPFPRPEDR